MSARTGRRLSALCCLALGFGLGAILPVDLLSPPVSEAHAETDVLPQTIGMTTPLSIVEDRRNSSSDAVGRPVGGGEWIDSAARESL